MKDGGKCLIVGNAQHGKDTLAEIWELEFGMTFKSSSEKGNELFIFDNLRDLYNYHTLQECFDDRVNHRDEWFDMITEYNLKDAAKLAKQVIHESDCYVGMRSIREIKECDRIGLFDIKIWVDASERVPMEDSSSIDISKDDADIIIENNGTREEFMYKAIKLGSLIL